MEMKKENVKELVFCPSCASPTFEYMLTPPMKEREDAMCYHCLIEHNLDRITEILTQITKKQGEMIENLQLEIERIKLSSKKTYEGIDKIIEGLK
jgi:Zn-finger protein